MRAGNARTSRTAIAAATVAVLAALGACGGQSPYCQTVQDDQATLESFGSSRTTEAYTGYAAALTSISEVAPAESKKQWSTLAAATQGVLQAHDDIGFALEDMGSADKRASLSESDIAVLDEAYGTFNDTTAEREAVIENVESSCDIELK